RDDFSAEECEAIDSEFQAKLHAAQQHVKTAPPRRRGMTGFAGHWKGLTAHYSHAPVETGIPIETLERITAALTNVPDSFTLNPKIARLLETRQTEMRERRPIDWSFAEALAFGS